jgi:hypothetical protein
MRENNSPEDDKEAADQVKNIANKETYSEFAAKKIPVPEF